VSKPSIVKFEPDGPDGAGLAEWFEIDSNDLVSGHPVQKVHIYHQDESTGYLTGVWDCTAMTMKPGPYPDNEFMLLLDGSLEFVLEDGAKVTVNAGEAFVIPKGLHCQWIQPGYVRKFFMIFGNPGGRISEDVQSQGVIKLKAKGPASGFPEARIEDSSQFQGDVPVQHKHIYFDDPSGQMQVGLWDSTPFETATAPFPRNELMCLLEGSVTLTDGDGRERHFKAGDTVYLPQGAACGWRSTEYVRKFYSIYEPSSAGAAD
jgi:uncharacterized cupin superfamily protein